MAPVTTNTSARLKTANLTKSTWTISVTYPITARSIRLPTAPASNSIRVKRPKGWRTQRRRMARISRRETSSEIPARTMVALGKEEKAAPVF